MWRCMVCGVMFFSILACKPPPEFGQTFEIGNFNRSDTLVCVIPDRIEGALSVNMALSHSTGYPYENLYIRVEYRVDDIKPASNVRSVQLVDPFGRWIGNCRSGSCDLAAAVLDTLPSGTGRKILITQYSRNEILHGVNSLELSFYPVVASPTGNY